MSGPIDRPVGDREGFASVVLRVVPLLEPNVREAVIRQPSAVHASDRDPLKPLRLLIRAEQQLAVGVRELGEVARDDLPLRLARNDLLLLPAEQLDVGLRDRLTAHRVGNEMERLPFELFLHDDRVGHPQNDAAAVAVRHL